MRAARADVALAPEPPSSPEARLRSLVDWALLARRGYDASAEVFTPEREDPLFGYKVCEVVACEQLAEGRLRLCWRCEQHWKQAGPGVSFASFCHDAPGPLRRRRGDALCTVCRAPGHERPVHTNGLCISCYQTMAKRGQTPEEYIAGDDEFPPAVPRPSFGRCSVTICSRFAWRGSPALCEQHHARWSAEGRPGGPAMQTWCSRQGSLKRDGRVVFSGLPERLLLDLLYGLQRCADMGHKARAPDVQTAVNVVRAQGVGSLLQLSLGRVKPSRARLFLSFAADHVALALSDRESEASNDAWDMRVFGKAAGRLRFGLLNQAWLRSTAKAWAAERADTVETARPLQDTVRALIAFSQSLRRNRPDGGADCSLLQRADLAMFANDLAHLEASGDLSRSTRRRWVAQLDRFLREARALGLSRPGGPMHGLAEDVVVPRNARVQEGSPGQPGKALPQVVIDQLLDPAALALLEEAFGSDRRAMVELQASVGRRTGELCALRLECLDYEELVDEAGQLRRAPVLVHDMPKVGVVGYRLPIDDETAKVVRAQQARVAARYPGTEPRDLALFPAPLLNPQGTKAVREGTFLFHFRAWVEALPELRGEDGEPYDRQGITFYSFRHSFAQRYVVSNIVLDDTFAETVIVSA